MKIDIGTVGITRDKKRISILGTIGEGEPGYDQGYRFKGESDLTGQVGYQTRAYILYNEEGRHFWSDSHVNTSSPSDIIRIVNHNATILRFCDVDVGDIAGEHTPGSDVITNGPFGGWVLSGIFPIRQSLYSAHLPYSNSRLVQDDEIMIASICKNSIMETESLPDDVITSVLVVWKTEKGHYMSVAEMPSSVS